MHELITQERLKYLLYYQPETGHFIWKNITGKRAKIGDIAGHKSKDYITIRIDKKLYHAQVLAFFYMTGKWPQYDIDHKDLNKTNNIWENLREATRSQNGGNKTKYITNKSGIKGVSWSKRQNKWVAQITIRRKQKI